ncbi:cell surface protein [Clostridium sp. JS66]|uniref:cell surface protein n=1 Tax=Clostridium sp. JS66 TaxID=3064705 RepID=UPI00298D9107|nr:cell surface protein [Clostridium sp. JS66]WPC39250.1 cell surface protein [Clostridium sp. JS66]
MYKNKKILAVLSTAAVTGLLISTINSTAFAKTTAIAVNSTDGKIYEYQYDALKASLVSESIHGSNYPGAKLYNDFLQRKMTVRAYYDDKKKSYIESDTISKEIANCMQKGTSFDLNSFTESANTPAIKLTTNTVSTDSFGNLLINGQTVSEKPTVKSVKVIDNKTIRVCFNKKVDYNYATNVTNYKLLNSLDTGNIDISNHISGIYNSQNQSDTQNTDTYDIKLKDCNPYNKNEDWKLVDSKYTLVIENIIDTSTIHNAMDTYTCILDANFSAPSVTGMYKNISSSTSNKIIVYFSEAMDVDTIANRNNYKFIDGLGNVNPLPEAANIIIGKTSKSARIEFPSSYHISTNTTQKTGNSNDIIGLTVSNVKDASQNILKDTSYKGTISEPKLYDTYVKSNSIKGYYDKDDLIIDVSFSGELDDITSRDFTFGGVRPDAASVVDDRLILRFVPESLPTASEISAHPVTYANGKTNTSPTKIDIIKAQGPSAKLVINPNSLVDETGASVACTLSDEQSKIYDDELPPRTAPNYWSATKESDGVNVYITYDTPLYISSGLRPDDFIFTSTNGKNLLADSVKITGNTLVFNFKSTNENYALLTNSINVKCKNTICLLSNHGLSGDFYQYIPSNDDLSGRIVNVAQ